MRKLEEYPWWKDLVALKDVLSLRELAERFSVTPGAISMAFKRNGIERESAPPGPRDRRRKKEITSEVAEILSKDAVSNEKAPEELIESKYLVTGPPTPPTEEPSVTTPVTSTPDLLAPFEDMLGEVPDEEIANLAGVPVKEVTRFREQRESQGADSAGRKASKLAAFADILGKVPDRVVAEQANLSVSAVCVYRRRRGIPAYVPQEPEVKVEQPAAPAPVVEIPVPTPPVAVPEPVPLPKVEEEKHAAQATLVVPADRKAVREWAEHRPTPVFGYMATIGEKQFIIVGKDLLAAAEIAMAADLGMVERIDLIGPAL